MATVPPIAKVICPTSTGYFPRHRLYRALDKARKAPVLWITGPPGCGKTALVSSYIESRLLPCLWYKVDEADADLATFFYYLGLAAAKAAPRKKKRLPLLTPERMPGLSVFSQRYFEDLSSLLPVPSLLVFDDCHRMREDSAFFDTLREGISRLAPGIGAVFVSRNDPHPSFARDRANQLMETFGWKDLRLTVEEATGIVKLQRKGRPPPGLVRDLFERTDGWAAGLVLLLERTDKGRMESQTIGRQVPAEIIDYFGSEIFRRLDEKRRGFLLRTAFLPRMTASMAEKLTGDERAAPILSEMNRQNQFTKKYPQREPVYEYHDLFREFLLEQAKGVFLGEKLAEIRKAAAVLLEQAGYVEDAALLFRESGDWKGLSWLILSHARSLVGQGRYQTMLEWLGALPREVLDGEPWLLYWNGVCLMPFSPSESRALFEEALREFDARQEAPGVFRSWSGVVESIITPAENFSPLNGCISLLPRLLEKYGGLPSGEIGDEVTCIMYRALSLRQYPRAAVELWTPRAITVAQTTTDRRLKFILNLGFLVSFQITKDTREAGRMFASLREMLRQPDATPLMRLTVDMVEAVLLVLSARYERCLHVTTDGLAFAEKMGVHFADAFLQVYVAEAALMLRDFETANRFLDQLAATLDTMKPLPLGQFHHLVASEALHRRDLARAYSHSRECMRLWEESGFTTHIHAAWILAAHVHHALHEDEDAFRLVAETRRNGYEIRNFYGVWASYLTEAYFHLERDDDAAAIVPLRKGLQVGRQTGLFGASLEVQDMFERISAKALEEGIEVDYVRELIRRNQLAPDPANPDLERWPWPVKVYTLGRFGLLVNDRPVEFGRKVQQKPLALLKALVALGGREVPEAKLTEFLWPEADGDLAHNSFEVALSRLRKLLGTEDALVLKEGRLSLSNRHCWVDVWAFARSLGEAEKARKEGKRTEAIRGFEKALSLYRGPFLQSEEMTCAASPREKLRSGFLRAVAHLGQCYEDRERWEEAVSCYGKGIEADDLAEELYRRLMVCHIRQGREAEALSVYRRCRKTLSSVLGVEPSAETRAIAASLGRSPG
jgi:ATP/maltotriose-dependent transcriptional regulator MalT/DNA-binding SARP family transcriptional activator